MILDIQCTSEECKEVKRDAIVKNEESIPPCEKCGAPTKRLWTLDRLPGEHANASSLRFHFNYQVD